MWSLRRLSMSWALRHYREPPTEDLKAVPLWSGHPSKTSEPWIRHSMHLMMLALNFRLPMLIPVALKVKGANKKLDV